MSPIFVRPVREQLEHDRLIRFLQARYKRKLEAAINVGDERVVPVKIGEGTFFPDLVLTAGKKLAGLVEVETGESVNNLEAMAQWTHFSKARVPFHLYVPVPGYDAARRLCEANGARPSEIWTYRPTHDGFDLVRIHHDTSAVSAAVKAAPVAKPAPVAKAVAAPKEAKPAKAKAAPKAKPPKPAKVAKKPAKPAKIKKKK
ncbi:MAG TPA: hypothetical protein VN700_09185 [Vicinamibacterales bacterium]|nr:hypothetical protein [Vicinamibacterales bacterium]